METLSLKALANKVLQGNRQGNLVETRVSGGGKLEGESFRGGKPESVPLPNTLEDFRVLFEKADSEMVAAYLPGTLEMIREGFPELWGEIQDAENRINILWLQARGGTGDMEAFRESAKKWKVLHLRAIRFFSLMERWG